MTPKEKANDLVNEYRMILMDEDTNCGNEIICTIIAIKFAKATVNEIIKSSGEYFYFSKAQINWWLKVINHLDEF